MEWLREVDIADSASDMTSHGSPLDDIDFAKAKAACEKAYSSWLANAPTRDVRGENGILGGAQAHDPKRREKEWEQDRKAFDLRYPTKKGASAVSTKEIGERLGIGRRAVRAAIQRHCKEGDDRGAEILANKPGQRESRERLMKRLSEKKRR